MSEYPSTGNPAIDEDIPGISVIDYDENACSDTDIGDRLPFIAKWIRCLTQNDNVTDVTNIFGHKEIPCHYSYEEIIDGYAAKGHDITMDQAHKVAKRCASELRSLGMIVKVIEHPDMVVASDLVDKLASLIEDDSNILLYGLQGVGKTAMVDQACVKLGYVDAQGKVDHSRVQYFSTATLAPEDFVGIPAPNPNDPETFNYLMMAGFFNAEVLVLDELNRAHPKVLNGVFQILHGRAINTHKLPKLKSVVAMINPIDEGNFSGAEDLDDALVDRFDHFIEVKAEPSAQYLASRFTEIKDVAPADALETAEILVDWWKTELANKKQQSQVSPRRLEKIGRAHLMGHGIENTLYRKKTTISLQILGERLKGRDLLTARSLAENPQDAIARIAAGTAESMELAQRAAQLVEMYYKKADYSRMSKAIEVLEVFDKDALTKIKRDPNMLTFVQKASKRVGKESWLEGLFATSEAGTQALAERRAAVAQRLAQANAAGGEGKVTL